MTFPKRNIFKRIFAHTFLLLNIALCLWSLLCVAACFVSSMIIGWMGVLSITIPFVLICHLFFLIFWPLVHKWRRTWLSAVTLAGCYWFFMPVFGFNFFTGNDFSTGAKALKVMTWNCHGFGIYEPDSAKGEIYASNILSNIKTENPDILCLPEFNVMKNDSLAPNVSTIMHLAGYTQYKYFADNTYGRYINLGTAIFSRFPITNFTVYPLDRREKVTDNGTTYLQQCDILLPNGKTMRLFTVHLYSFGFSEYDISVIERWKGRPATDTVCDYDPDFVAELNMRHIPVNDHPRVFLFRFMEAYRKRSREADEIARIIAQSPYPALICGDFNDVPASYTYNTIRGNNKDAFMAKGRGFGRTFRQILPTLRIDFIFYNPQLLQAKGYKTIDIVSSDHKPVVAGFSMK